MTPLRNSIPILSLILVLGCKSSWKVRPTVFPGDLGQSAPSIVSAQANPKEESDPRDEPPPVIYGEEIEDECPIDVDIHLPAAQDPAQPLVPEGRDEKEGSWTLRNDDMDATTADIIALRLRSPTDLLGAEGKPDLAMQGAVAAENDLVAVDVHNPTGLVNVYLNVYAMAAQDGPNDVRTHPVQQRPNRTADRLAIWRNADRTGVVTLPMPVPGARDRVWVEGLGAGRYRFVLLHIPNGTPAQANQVRATEVGGPHGQVTPGTVTLTPGPGVKVVCFKHVRLTVAVADVFQKARREHLYDVLWGGRPVFEGRVWPGGGTYTWEQNAGFAGTWLQGAVHGVPVAPNGQAAAGYGLILKEAGAFEPNVEAVGQPVQGSGRYEHRIRLRYKVEGVDLVREEPVTLMAPHHVTIQPDSLLAQGFARPHWGTAYEFTLKAKYTIYDQHDRKLVGPAVLRDYLRQYGARLQAYEALGMGAQAFEANDRVEWRYVSPLASAPNRRFTLPFDTKQRSMAVPPTKSLSDGEFSDNFTLRITNQQRGMIQDDIRADNTLASRTVISISQDIVTLLRNGAGEYDIRVARGNRLQILAPQQRPAPAAPWGGMGFQLDLGGPGGTQLDTANPDRVGPNHNPPPP